MARGLTHIRRGTASTLKLVYNTTSHKLGDFILKTKERLYTYFINYYANLLRSVVMTDRFVFVNSMYLCANSTYLCVFEMFRASASNCLSAVGFDI